MGSDEQVRIGVLIPDFQGSEKALQTVLNAKPNVLNHIYVSKSVYMAPIIIPAK
jgi:lipoate synthase